LSNMAKKTGTFRCSGWFWQTTRSAVDVGLWSGEKSASLCRRRSRGSHDAVCCHRDLGVLLPRMGGGPVVLLLAAHLVRNRFPFNTGKSQFARHNHLPYVHRPALILLSDCDSLKHDDVHTPRCLVGWTGRITLEMALQRTAVGTRYIRRSQYSY
jgi:hypothetical protein